VAVDLFMQHVPRPVQTAVDTAWLTLTALVAAFLVYWMVFGMIESRNDDAVTAVLGWPVWPFYVPGIVAMALWALVAVAQLFGDLSDA
jgi:TRAP-type C4-dicarboxylate transport system permease small subunit